MYANLKVGDLVFFNTTGRTASHVGIYIGDNKFIQAGTSTGVVVASLSSSYWGPKYDGARRISNFTTSTASTPEVKGAQVDFSVYASRGEVALKLAKELGLNTSNKKSPFTDVPSTSKYAGAVTALNKLGIFTGVGNNKFSPNSPLTREQLAKILVVGFELKKKNKTLNFTDVSKNGWSYQYIQNLASNGVTVGIGNNKFGTNNNVKIVDLNTFIQRAKNVK